jgi:hypothetical protein
MVPTKHLSQTTDSNPPQHYAWAGCMRAGVGVACVDGMPYTNWRQSDLSLACTYHSPPWCGMPTALRSLQIVDLKDYGGLPWPKVAPVSCVVSAMWGYLASGIQGTCPSQRNRRCASKEAKGLTWPECVLKKCKLCQNNPWANSIHIVIMPSTYCINDHINIESSTYSHQFDDFLMYVVPLLVIFFSLV